MIPLRSWVALGFRCVSTNRCGPLCSRHCGTRSTARVNRQGQYAGSSALDADVKCDHSSTEVMHVDVTKPCHFHQFLQLGLTRMNAD